MGFQVGCTVTDESGTYMLGVTTGMTVRINASRPDSEGRSLHSSITPSSSWSGSSTKVSADRRSAWAVRTFRMALLGVL